MDLNLRMIEKNCMPPDLLFKTQHSCLRGREQDVILGTNA